MMQGAPTLNMQRVTTGSSASMPMISATSWRTSDSLGALSVWKRTCRCEEGAITSAASRPRCQLVCALVAWLTSWVIRMRSLSDAGSGACTSWLSASTVKSRRWASISVAW